jgi:hypothetical protein
MVGMNVEHLLRIKGTVDAAAGANPREGGEGLIAAYPRLRAEVVDVIDDQHRIEFDRLFPATITPDGGAWVAEAEEVKLTLALIGGWLDGIVNGALLDRRIVAEAQAKAAEKAKQPVGFG